MSDAINTMVIGAMIRMNNAKDLFFERLKDENGLTTLEQVLLIALSLGMAIAVFNKIGPAVMGKTDETNKLLGGASFNP